MSDTAPERVDAAVSYSRHDEALVEPILTALRGEGLSIWFDKDIPGGALWEEIIARKYRAAGALLFFVSKASLASQRCSEEVSTARTLGKPIIPVLLERLKLPDDLPDRFVLTLQARNVVEAFNEPEEEKKRGILRALAALGIAGAAAGVAQADSMSATQTRLPQGSGAESSSGAKIAHIDPLAKSNAGVVKASSTISMKTVAFGGAAAATLLVVGAIILMQNTDRAAAPARSATGAPSTSSVAKDAKDEPASPVTPAAPAPTELASGDARAILQQTSYPAGKPIPLRVEGLPGNDNDLVAIAAVGSPAYAQVRYEYLRGKKSADVTLRAVMKPGDYEVRIFFGSDSGEGKDVIRFSAPLTITPAAPITLKMDSQRVTEGQPLRIRYDGMPGNDKDWIATAQADADGGTYIDYVYTKGAASGLAELPPFVKPGQYEIRAYFDDLTSDRTVQARIPVEVIPAPPVTLTLDAAAYAPGDTITLTFADMPGNKKDWVALARPGDNGYLTYEYLNARKSGTQTLRAPDEPGDYEIRGYFDDATGDKTIRATASFTVGEAVAPSPTAEPTPEPTPEAIPEPTPEPTLEVTPEPIAEPTPEDVSQPAPTGEPAPTP